MIRVKIMLSGMAVVAAIAGVGLWLTTVYDRLSGNAALHVWIGLVVAYLVGYIRSCLDSAPAFTDDDEVRP